MKDVFDGILMFSGGLDSTIAAHLLKSQGLSILAIHFVLPFYAGLDRNYRKIRSFASDLGIPLKIIEEGEEFFEMFRSPRFGYGKRFNPCLDCRIRRLNEARKIMEEAGSCFVATGEVVGQRPKSQRLQCLQMIEKRTGLKGRLLRPLSAKLLEPTICEQEGIVNRERLLAISGRSRHEQLAYAQTYGLQYFSPAGGCLLTDVGFARRYRAMAEKYPEHTFKDFKLLAYGRHFAIGKRCRLLVSRNEAENRAIKKIISEDDMVFEILDTPGPVGIGRGEFSEEELTKAASILLRYSRARNSAVVRVKICLNGGGEKILTAAPADHLTCESCRM